MMPTSAATGQTAANLCDSRCNHQECMRDSAREAPPQPTLLTALAPTGALRTAIARRCFSRISELWSARRRASSASLGAVSVTVPAAIRPGSRHSGAAVAGQGRCVMTWTPLCGARARVARSRPGYPSEAHRAVQRLHAGRLGQMTCRRSTRRGPASAPTAACRGPGSVTTSGPAARSAGAAGRPAGCC